MIDEPRTGRARRAQGARGWVRSLAGWVLLAATAAVLTGCAAVRSGSDLPQSALDPAGPVARAQDQLWNLVFPIAVVVFVIVEGALVYAIVRFRDRGGDDVPRQVHGNTRLEIIWTVIPALLLLGLAVPTVQTIFELDRAADEGALHVTVVGKQYWWEFTYEDSEVITANELYIPTGRDVVLTLDGTTGESDHVLHSFWVPRLGGKRDYVPGHIRTMRIGADEPGVYPGQCAEYCGLSHANMRFFVYALEPGEFDEWLAAQAEPAVTGFPEGSREAEGEREFAGAGCIGCHAISGYEGAEATFGPDLTHFASREWFAGAIFRTENTEQLADWLRDPPGAKPGSQMPALGLTEDQIASLVAYLQSLE